MTSRERQHAFLWVIESALVIQLLSGAMALAQQNKFSGPVSRDCTNAQIDAHGKKPKPSKRRLAEPIEPVPVCSEVRDSALAAQEYLQKYVREQRWNLSDEQISEDLWTFSIDLSKEELFHYAKLAPNARIEWSGGKVLVNLRTMSLDDGYARVVVTARIDAYGQPEDALAPRPKSWPVSSSCVFEAALLSALQAHLRAVW